MPKLEEKNCPNCSKEMIHVREANVRIILGRRIILPGAPIGYKCEDCDYKEIVPQTQQKEEISK